LYRSGNKVLRQRAGNGAAIFLSDRMGCAEFRAGAGNDAALPPKNKKPAEAGFLQDINAC
jgi:hypothetical protein